MEHILDHQQVLSILPDRDLYAHKGNFGRVLLLCGSCGFTGAAALAAMGALRCGAGLVYVGVPECIYAIEAIKLTEPVVFPLPASDGKLSADGAEEISGILAGMNAVLIGPGLGISEGTFTILETVLRQAECPVVIDADGINLLAGHKDMLRGRSFPTILTPHFGEFQRIGGDSKKERQAAAMGLANELGAIILLKGKDTVITDGSTVYINPTGNPGMAVGGSGDMLAGMITALLGQGIEPLQAAACGAWLHGTAGDRCAKRLGQYAMLPTDMLEELPRLMK